MSNFRKGENVRFGFDFSDQTFHGTIILVKSDSCLINVEDKVSGKSERVNISHNFLKKIHLPENNC